MFYVWRHNWNQVSLWENRVFFFLMSHSLSRSHYYHNHSLSLSLIYIYNLSSYVQDVCRSLLCLYVFNRLWFSFCWLRSWDEAFPIEVETWVLPICRQNLIFRFFPCVDWIWLRKVWTFAIPIVWNISKYNLKLHNWNFWRGLCRL